MLLGPLGGPRPQHGSTGSDIRGTATWDMITTRTNLNYQPFQGLYDRGRYVYIVRFGHIFQVILLERCWKRLPFFPGNPYMIPKKPGANYDWHPFSTCWFESIFFPSRRHHTRNGFVAPWLVWQMTRFTVHYFHLVYFSHKEWSALGGFPIFPAYFWTTSNKNPWILSSDNEK